jgi:hypothetical protein
VRYLFFLLAIAAGVGLGLLYGWVISPVQLVDTAPSSLRADYKADYVLMVAEAHQVQPDLTLAALRLAQLGGYPLETVQQAVAFSAQVGYDPRDLALMRALAEALKAYSPALEPGGTPAP